MEKNRFSEIDSIIFDLDGTLWDSSDGVLKAWNQVLARHKDIKEHLTREVLQNCMGLQVKLIGQKLFPYLSEERRMELLDTCCKEENELLKTEGGILYSGLKEVLQDISKKYPLFIVSNCQEGYIEAFLTAHDMWEYFKDIQCAGRTGLSKGENIKGLMERNRLKHSIYVGDTQGDCDAARLAGIPFVFAGYGFGKVKENDALIENISELKDILLT
ncbi:MAG: HAD family hydrolase [Bacillota bacterium]|nr:HAD family hydrolase [Bacillota bacterium]